jgi:glycosyltransferase involved in cell wall biosynthesis
MRRQTTVLHLIDSFQQGGSEAQAVQLVRLLKATGRYRILMACLNEDGPLRSEIDHLGLNEIKQYQLTSFRSIRSLIQLRKFATHLKTQKVDILHTHDFYTNVFGMFAGAVAGTAVRIAARRESSRMRSTSRRLLERVSYRMATRVVANCEEVRRQLTAEGVSSTRIDVVYNGIDPTRMRRCASADRSAIAASFGLPTDPARVFITIVANLRLSVKDHATFLRAARVVLQVFPQATFVLAGEGNLTNPMRLLASDLGIADRTFFLGRCGRVAELLSITDIGVLSSLCEGFPNAILEYMAAGCPVVATDVGGIREAVIEGETGYLVEARDHDALAKRILCLLDAPERARAMGMRGRRIVQQKFSLQSQLQAVAKLYERLLGIGAIGPNDGNRWHPTQFSAAEARGAGQTDAGVRVLNCGAWR